jgi:hypothetical protein
MTAMVVVPMAVVVAVMAMMAVMPISFRPTIILRLGILRLRVLRLTISVSAAILLLLLVLLAGVVTAPATNQAAQQTAAGAARLVVPAAAVLVLVLELRLDGVRSHGAGHAAQDLAQLAVSHLAAEEGTARGAQPRRKQAAVLLFAVRAGRRLTVVIFAATAAVLVVCVARLPGTVVRVCGCRAWRQGWR